MALSPVHVETRLRWRRTNLGRRKRKQYSFYIISLLHLIKLMLLLIQIIFSSWGKDNITGQPRLHGHRPSPSCFFWILLCSFHRVLNTVDPVFLPRLRWPDIGPVPDEGVRPLRLVQSNLSFLLWLKPQKSLSKLQLNPNVYNENNGILIPFIKINK